MLAEWLAGAAILRLVTYRPGYRLPWLDKSYATQMALSPLSSADSQRVVLANLCTTHVPEPLIQAILVKAQGNPDETDAAPDRVYTFRHILVQEVAYQSLLAHARQQLHGAGANGDQGPSGPGGRADLHQGPGVVRADR